MPACPLSTLRRPSYDKPTQDSGSWLIATHYHVVDFHHRIFAGFYRRFLNVPISTSRMAIAWILAKMILESSREQKGHGLVLVIEAYLSFSRC